MKQKFSILHPIGGIVLVLLGLLAIVLEITTNEALLLGNVQTALLPSIQILGQIPALIGGTLPANMVLPVLVSYAAEVFVLVLVIAFEVTYTTLRFHNETLAEFFKDVLIGALLWDLLTNWFYTGGVAASLGTAAQLVVRAFATVFLTATVAFSPVVGTILLEHTVAHYTGRLSLPGGRGGAPMLPSGGGGGTHKP